MSYLRETDYLVVGAGVMGAATAWALTRSGRDVVLLERSTPANLDGSSHGRSRIFRLSYPDPSYVEMARKALKLWRRIEEESGEELLTTLGGFDLGDGATANAAALETAGVAYEQLTGREAAPRFPHVSFDRDEHVLYQPDAGIVAAERAVTALVRLAVGRGLDLRASERALAIQPGDESADVRTDHAVFRAKRVVVTAGAWARPLLETAGIDLPVRVTRETVGYFEHPGPTPSPTVEWGRPALYSLPSPGQGLKAAQHGAGPEVDPDTPATPSTHSMEIVSSWVQQRFPNVNPTPHRVETCVYTNTADESFVLDRHGPVVVGSPCSGHGFKFAPLIGQTLANLAEGLEE